MELSQARFITIDGTSVTAKVDTADQAKIAIKEIRQKKKEFAHIKRGLLRDRKALERIANTKSRKKAKDEGLLSRIGSTISTVAGIAGAYGTASARMDLPRIEEECARTDEILHNLDTVLIQMEGKLLRLS